MSKSLLAVLLAASAIYGMSEEPEIEVKTDKEGMKEYLLKQSKLAKGNKISKRKLRKASKRSKK